MNLDIAKELTSEIKAELLSLGVDWQAVAFSDSVRGKVWRAPPLIHEGFTYGIDNRDLMQVSIPLSFEDFEKAYEQHVGWCSLGLLERFPVTKREFALTMTKATQLLPETNINTLYNFVPALAALAYYNYGGEIETMNYQSLVVTVGPYKFGVKNGEAMSNTGEDYCRVPNKAYLPPHVVYGRRRTLIETQLSTRFSTILENAKMRSGESLNCMEAAMALLICNDCLAIKELWLLGNTGVTSYPKAVQEMLQVARTFRDYQDPLTFLKEQLVPFSVTAEKFFSVFGRSRKITPDRLDELDRGIDYLIEETNRERESIC